MYEMKIVIVPVFSYRPLGLAADTFRSGSREQICVRANQAQRSVF